MTTDVNKATRWGVFIVFVMIGFVNNIVQYLPAFFAQDLMADFQVSTTGFALLSTVPMILGLILSPIGGSMSDRWGMKRMLLIAGIISSVAMLARFFATSFIMLLITTALLGCICAFQTVNQVKLGMTWFGQASIGMVAGVCTGMNSAGIAVAQAFAGVLFPDYHIGFLIGGIMVTVMTLLWAIIGKDAPKRTTEVPPVIEPTRAEKAADRAAAKAAAKAAKAEENADGSQKQGMSAVIKSKNIWFAGIGMGIGNSFTVLTGNFLITALAVYWGTDPVQAGMIASLFTVGNIFGGILVPTVVTRMKAAKPICIALPLLTAATFFLGWVVDITVVRCIMLTVSGFFFGGVVPILMSCPSILPEVGNENSGTAGGLLVTIMMVGAVVIPTFIITPIAGSDYNMIMILSIVAVAIVAVFYAILPSLYAGGQGGSASATSAAATEEE